MDLETRLKKVILIGALIGAILGAGTAYLLSTAPSDEESDETISAKELLGLTSLAALLIRRVDNIRRKL